MKIIISVFKSFDSKFLITSYLISAVIFLIFWGIVPTNKISYMLLLIANVILYPFSRMVYYQIKNIINRKREETIRKNSFIVHILIQCLIAIGLFICSIFIAPFGFLYLTIRVLRMERKQKKRILR